MYLYGGGGLVWGTDKRDTGSSATSSSTVKVATCVWLARLVDLLDETRDVFDLETVLVLVSVIEIGGDFSREGGIEGGGDRLHGKGLTIVSGLLGLMPLRRRYVCLI